MIDALAQRTAVTLARHDAWTDAAFTAEAELGGEPVILAEPRTYMNRSGRAALDLVRRFDLAPEHVLVVYDDADLALGRLRIRPGGGAGGHNGIRSLMDTLGTGEFPRVKLGVRGDERASADLADYVLEEFLLAERPVVEALVSLGADAVEAVVREGLAAAMNAFNPRTAS